MTFEVTAAFEERHFPISWLKHVRLRSIERPVRKVQSRVSSCESWPPHALDHTTFRSFANWDAITKGFCILLVLRKGTPKRKNTQFLSPVWRTTPFDLLVKTRYNMLHRAVSRSWATTCFFLHMQLSRPPNILCHWSTQTFGFCHLGQFLHSRKGTAQRKNAVVPVPCEERCHSIS